MSGTASYPPASAVMSFEPSGQQQVPGWPSSVSSPTMQPKRHYVPTHDNPFDADALLKRARYDDCFSFDGPQSNDNDDDVCMAAAAPLHATHSSAMITPTHHQSIRLSPAGFSSSATGDCWWKAKTGQSRPEQQQQHQPMPDRCIVCRGSREAAAPPAPRPGSLSVGNRILDGYFSKSASSNQRTSVMTASVKHGDDESHARPPTMNKCSFCGKSVCHQCCHECGRCFQEFCSFCLTSDYANGLEHGCLDCVRDLDRMQVDG